MATKTDLAKENAFLKEQLQKIIAACDDKSNDYPYRIGAISFIAKNALGIYYTERE